MAIHAYVTGTTAKSRRQSCIPRCNWVRKEIGSLATRTCCTGPDSLPKTCSARLCARILRKIAAGDTSNLGDTSTLADPRVVDKLLEEKQAIAMPS